MMGKRVPESEPFWLATRLKDVNREITNLLSWGDHPNSADITDGWLAAMKEAISGAVRRAIQAGTDGGNTRMEAKLRKAQSMAYRLAMLMRDLPDLSTKPVTQWEMKGHRQLWDDLDSLAREFLEASEKIDAASTRPANETPNAPPVAVAESSPPEYSSATDLATRLQAGKSAVESWLRRYRGKYPDCFITNDSPRKNEPKYLYRTADVWHDLQENFAK